MKKMLKISSVVLGSLVALIIVTLISITLFVNPNDFKPTISKIIYQHTGRRLVIGGDIDWTLFPWLGVRVNDVTLGNAPGFVETPFAQIGTADVRIRLLPLITGQIRAGRIILKNAKIYLERNRQGRTNWDDLTKLKSTLPKDVKPKIAPLKEKDLRAGMVAISAVNISNALISWNDQQNRQQAIIKNFNFKSGKISINRTIKLNSNFNFKTTNPNTNGYFNLKTRMNMSPVNKFYALKDLQITGYIKTPDFKKNLDFKLKTDVVAQPMPSNITIPSIKATFDQTTLQGKVKKIDLNKKSVNFNLDIDNINLDRYTSKDSSRKTTNSGSAATKPPSALNQWTINGDVKIGKFTANNINLSNFYANINANKGIINVAPITANFYKGKLNSQIKANTRGVVPFYSTVLGLKDVQIGDFLADSTGVSRISGTTKFDANLTTSGSNTDSMLRTLNGNGSIAIKNGALQGVDIDNILNHARALVQKQILPKITKDPITYFGDFTGTFVIRNGILTNNDLLLISKRFRVTGRGYIDLPQQKVDYQVKAATPKAEQIFVPIKITGTFSKLRYFPDYNYVVTHFISGTAKSVVEGLKTGTGISKETGKAVGEQLKKSLGIEKLFK